MYSVCILTMDYKKLYDSLMASSAKRGWTKKSAPVYCEVHHIIPKSMGGDNSKSNKVVLTAREHLLAHRLLFKIYGNNKMAHALWAMLHDNRGTSRSFRLTSKEFAKARENAGNASRESALNRKNTKHTEETKRKLSIAHTGKVLSKETRDNMSSARQGNTCRSIGMYVTPEGMGRSLNKLAEMNGVSSTTLQSRCKKNKTIIESKKFKDFIGKTWRDLGWCHLKNPSPACFLDIPVLEKKITSYSHNKLEGKIDYKKYLPLLENRVLYY